MSQQKLHILVSLSFSEHVESDILGGVGGRSMIKNEVNVRAVVMMARMRTCMQAIRIEVFQHICFSTHRSPDVINQG